VYIAVHVGKKYSFRTGHLFLSLLPGVLSITAYLLFPNVYVFIGCLTVLSFLFVVSAKDKIFPYFNLAVKMLKSGKE
jgi:hypothetical protein